MWQFPVFKELELQFQILQRIAIPSPIPIPIKKAGIADKRAWPWFKWPLPYFKGYKVPQYLLLSVYLTVLRHCDQFKIFEGVSKSKMGVSDLNVGVFRGVTGIVKELQFFSKELDLQFPSNSNSNSNSLPILPITSENVWFKL